MNNRKICYNVKENINKERIKKMEKIYSNLSIENLTKTDWFNQFDKNQQQMIIIGLEEKIDVSIYAKKEFTWDQMQQIRLGLLLNVDVSVYAKTDFDKHQMSEIMLGLEDNLDISIYANPEYSWRTMKKIRTHLLKKSTL